MLIITLSIIAALLLALVAGSLSSKKGKPDIQPHKETPPLDCCGAHEVCEKELLLTPSTRVEYFNDEELDAFRNREPKSYNPSETEQFREVLYTMHEHEVAAWLRSLQCREIQLPPIVREEALMIVAELREAKPVH